jgi:hypothetical protein
MSSESDRLRGALRHWQEIDCRLNCGEFDADDVSRVTIEAGLARRVIGPGPPEGLQEVWVIEPVRSQLLVPGPVLLIAFKDGVYGGPRLYRPVSYARRFDSGAFS